METSKYKQAIVWMRRLLYSSDISASKLENKFAIYKASFPELLRDASSVLSSVETTQLFADNSTSKYYSINSIIEWVPELERQFKENPAQVLENFKRLQSLRRSSIVADTSNF